VALDKKRQEERLPVKVDIPKVGTAIDVSSGGMCVVVPTEHKVGERIRVPVPHPSGSVMGTQEAVVVWVDRSFTGSFRVGLRFLKKVLAFKTKKKQKVSGFRARKFLVPLALVFMTIIAVIVAHWEELPRWIRFLTVPAGLGFLITLLYIREHVGENL